MSKTFFGPSEDEHLDRKFIPPDYSPTEEDDDDIDEEILSKDEAEEDEIIAKVEEKKSIYTPKVSIPTANTTSWGNNGGLNTPFGNHNSQPSSGWLNNNRGSMWETNKPTQPIFGSNNSGSSMWGSGVSSFGNNKPREEINRNKDVIFCDFLDCIVETYQNTNHVPGLLPRDIYDLVPRFDVWERLKAFNPQRVYAMIPKNLMPSTNGSSAWEITLSYFCCSLSSYIRVPYLNCQILAQSMIGQPKEDIMLSIIDNPTAPLDRNKVVCLGIYSGVNGQSNIDLRAAQVCGIDYVDLYNLLNNMY